MIPPTQRERSSMKKIRNFKTIDELVAELDLSARISNYLKTTYEDREVMEAVTTGLRIATLQDEAPSKLTASSAMADLAVILRNAGYTYVPEDKREVLLRTITREQLSRYYQIAPEYLTPYDALFVTNKLTLNAYYTLSPLTKAQIRSGMETIEEILGETAYKILCLRHGVDENGVAIGEKTYDEIGSEIGQTGSNARVLYNKANRILKHVSNQSKLAEFAISKSELDYVRQLLLDERNKLLELPDVQRYFSISRSITITCADSYDGALIEDLNLSARAYSCLKRANFNTVGDIVARAKELRSVRNLGLTEFERIVAKMSELDIQLETD